VVFVVSLSRLHSVEQWYERVMNWEMIWKEMVVVIVTSDRLKFILALNEQQNGRQ
jgi:hypothetical protein